jgi:hypothetical protein
VAQRRPLVACPRAKLGGRPAARSAVFAAGTFSRAFVAFARAKLARPRPLVVATIGQRRETEFILSRTGGTVGRQTVRQHLGTTSVGRCQPRQLEETQ